MCGVASQVDMTFKAFLRSIDEVHDRFSGRYSKGESLLHRPLCRCSVMWGVTPCGVAHQLE
jgi:hypothetical protein